MRTPSLLLAASLVVACGSDPAGPPAPAADAAASDGPSANDVAVVPDSAAVDATVTDAAVVPDSAAPDATATDAAAPADAAPAPSGGFAGVQDSKFGKLGFVETDVFAASIHGGVARPEGVVLAFNDGKTDLTRAVRIGYDGKSDAAYNASAAAVFAQGKATYGTLGVDVDAEGRVLFLREATTDGAVADLVRLDASGKPDATFGKAGVVAIVAPFTVNLPYDTFAPISVRALKSGVLVTVTYHAAGAVDQSSDWMVARYTTTGTPDPTFDSDGWAKAGKTLEGAVNSGVVGEGPDGSVYVSRFQSKITTYHIAKLTAAGALDPAWGKDGVLDLAAGPSTRGFHGLFTDTQGRVYLLGTVPNAQNNTRWDGFAMRLLGNGSVDATFGKAGEFRVLGLPTLDSGSWRSTFFRLWFDGDGHIMLGGNTWAPTSGWPANFLLFRLSADGVPDPTFPFTLKSDKLSDVSFPMGLARVNTEVDGHEGLVIASPDGKSVMNFCGDSKTKKLFVARWK